ncbi:MAG: gliding motility-associated C-terminal domain-containing protein, partial [Bacteroidetes bacterium]|nr:gliding motility-associated C-terminal domain-containing protein [Bacteroidota bacterium]
IDIVSPIEMYENDEEQAEVIGNAVDWYWTPPYGLSCINCKEPIINADSSMIYILQAINNGCISYDTLVVNIKNLKDCLVIPTAFSPNGDAVNNTFKPIVLDEKTIVQSFTIYNRWGEKIHDSLLPWDGTYKGQPQNIGVYMYVVEYYCDGENKVLSGNVTLIR